MLQDAINAVGLSHLVPLLEEVARPSIRLFPHAVSESEVALGASKFGGSPDLPKGTSWPSMKIGLSDEAYLASVNSAMRQAESPLAFVAQMNLVDIAAYDTDQVLPSHGMLYFFLAAAHDTLHLQREEEVWRSVPDHWRVLYYPGEAVTALERTAAPAALLQEGRYGAHAVDIAQEITLPNCAFVPDGVGGVLADGAGGYRDSPVLSDEQCEAYWRLQAQLAGYTYAGLDTTIVPEQHRLLGHPDVIQTPMELECELESRGIQSESDVTGGNIAPFMRDAADWRLLLQVDSFGDDERMRWGDGGTIYYWIRQQDLEHRDFTQAWFVLQSG